MTEKKADVMALSQASSLARDSRVISCPISTLSQDLLASIFSFATLTETLYVLPLVSRAFRSARRLRSAEISVPTMACLPNKPSVLKALLRELGSQALLVRELVFETETALTPFNLDSIGNQRCLRVLGLRLPTAAKTASGSALLSDLTALEVLRMHNSGR